MDEDLRAADITMALRGRRLELGGLEIVYLQQTVPMLLCYTRKIDIYI